MNWKHVFVALCVLYVVASALVLMFISGAHVNDDKYVGLNDNSEESSAEETEATFV